MNNANDNAKYKYSSKELDRENGFNCYYFGARYYDPAIGRWLAVDPLADKYPEGSSYNYCLNNPLRNIDQDGQESEDVLISSNKDKNKIDNSPHSDNNSTNEIVKLQPQYVIAQGIVIPGPFPFPLPLPFPPPVNPNKTLSPNDLGEIVNDVQGVSKTVESAKNALFYGAIMGVYNLFSEHTKNARPSTQGVHQKGQSRKKTDYGKEKADSKRRLPSKRPDKWKGPYPPK